MATKTVEVDLELKKAFTELQEMMIETKENINAADVQIEQQKRQKLHAELTKDEVSNLDNSTRTYLGIGRMFLLQDKDSTLKHIQERHQNAVKKIKELEDMKSKMEQNLKKSELHLRDMIQQRRDNN